MKKFRSQDFTDLAESLWNDYVGRKKDRKDLDHLWEEVDRQVDMEPAPRERALNIPLWVPEIELPMQADALEVLCADADRLQFPDSYDWFIAHAEANERYFQRLENDLEIDQDVEPRSFTQEDVNAVTEAALIHAHKQYDLKSKVAELNAEAFKYGTIAARVRQVKRRVYTNDYRGISADSQDLPVLVPLSIKNTYLDQKCDRALHHGEMIGPLQMYRYQQRVRDIQMAAKTGSSKMDDMNGGWIKGKVSRLEGDKDDFVEIIECEGDVILPRSRDSKFFPNVIVTVVKDKAGPCVVRFRENKLPFHSLITESYYKDKIGGYGVSPLMKGYPVQKLAVEEAIDMMCVSKLQARPPMSWNPHDSRMVATGGPVIEPGAMFSAFTDPKTLDIGNLDQSLATYAALLKQYEEVTGVSPVRAGGQTKSHQSATAVTIEDNRGQTRTVAYVRRMSRGFLTNFLSMEMEILRRSMKRQTVYIPRYNSYVKMGKESVPDNATFNVVGAAGPFEKKQQQENKISALGALVQLEQMIYQLEQGGVQDLKKLDLNRVREEMLSAVIPDADVQGFFNEATQSGVPAPAPGGAQVPGFN